MDFIKKHRLSISVILFTLIFYFLFLYIDLGQLMFHISKDNESFLKLFLKCWFFVIPLFILIPVMIVFLIQYIKNNKTKRKWLLISFVILFELIYTFIVSMYGMVPGFSFYPKNYNDDVLNYNNVRLVEVNVDGNIYKSSYYDNNKNDVTIFFTGNSQPSSSVISFFGETELELSERNLLVMDYPLFSYNEGRLTEDEIYKEVDAYMSFLIDDEGYDLSHIRVAGYSIGTGVASYCAEKYDVESLVLLAPYHSFYAPMNAAVPVFYGPLRFCVRFKFDSISRAKNIKCHTTVFYSKIDKAVPYESTLKLLEELNDYDTVEIENGTHSEVFGNKYTKNYILH